MTEDTRTVFATCHTGGCENEGHTIRANMPIPPAAASVACGACSNPITDITGTPPTQPTEIPEWLK